MDSLGDEPWDVVICGTGLQQSLVALALSRSKKRILHLDPNDYYGQHEAALSLQEADSFAAAHAGPATTRTEGKLSDGIIRNASVWKHPDAVAEGLAYPRAYSLALAPHIIYTRSKLLSQLVSSRAYRQVEFLAVGSFFVYGPAKDDVPANLSRVPSSREDVFSNSTIPVKSKRGLMKFLKFVIDCDSQGQQESWRPHADIPLCDFLKSQFKLDDNLCDHILALTLTLDGKITVKDGLATLSRHLTSMGAFGPGFCAVYPKWGGLSEVAQVACRAGAVGGAIYMLDTRMEAGSADKDEVILKGSSDISVQARLIVAAQDAAPDASSISRLVAIVKSPFRFLFQATMEGAPTPAVAVVAFPGHSIKTESPTDYPVYAVVHSSETGECPGGQCTVYLTTLASTSSKHRLEQALELLLSYGGGDETPLSLYQLYYEQTTGGNLLLREPVGSLPKFLFPTLSLGLTLDDTDLDPVLDAWKLVMGDDSQDNEFMVFEDREGADAYDDEVYE